MRKTAYGLVALLLCLSAPNVLPALPVATTILKFGFGADTAADIAAVGGVLGTIDDGNGSTPGDQNTGLDFLGFLSGTPSIPVAQASITIDGVSLTNPPAIMGSFFMQSTTGGTFQIWDDMNSLLLSGTFGDGVISGSLSGPSTGSFVSLSFGTFNGGSLQNQVDPSSSAVSLSFNGVNGGNGFSVSQMPAVLDDFTTDATGLISAAIPEPATGVLLLAGVIGALGLRRRA